MANYFQPGGRGGPPSNGNRHPDAPPMGHFRQGGGGAPHPLMNDPSHPRNNQNNNNLRAYENSQGGGAQSSWAAESQRMRYNNNSNNNQAAFPYAALGGGRSRDPIHSRGHYNSMPTEPQIQMNGGNNNNDFRYRSLESVQASMMYPQHMNRWNHGPQQQPQQQHHHYHHHPEYHLGHQYEQSQQPRNPSFGPINELKEQRPPPPVEMRPAPPPPLPAGTPGNANKRNGRGKDRPSSSRSSASQGGKTISKKPAPPLPPPAPTNHRPRPPPPPKDGSKNGANVGGPAGTGTTATTDSAVNAINALSHLQVRWAAPSADAGGNKRKGEGSDETKTQKRRRRRTRRGNRKNGGSGNSVSNNSEGSSSDNPVVILEDDAGKKGTVRGTEWVDVEEGSSIQRRGYDLTSGVKEDGFPPLASKKSEKEKDDALLVTLEDVSTPKLKSYAAILDRALDQKNADAHQDSSKDQEVHSLDDGDEEMDISDEEDGEDLQPKSKSSQDVQELKPERPAGEFEGIASESLPNDVGIASESLPNDVSKRNPEKSEKEKHSLKLAELRAKAKLARAKLRIAEQKKARGNISRESLDLSSKNGGEGQRNNDRPTRLANIKIGSLVIPDVSLTGPDDEVRFVDSVYKILKHEGKEDPGANTIINSTTKVPIPFHITPAQQNSRVVQSAPATVALSSEEKRKKTASLHQQLQLRRLQLEIMKKKKEALEKKKKKESLEPLPSVANKGGKSLASSLKGQHLEKLCTNADTSAQRKEVPFKDMSKNGDGSLQDENIQNEQSKGGGNDFMVQNSDSAVLNFGEPVNVQNQHSNRKQYNAAVSGSHTRVKRDQLIRRQKELKEENEIANLRNLIHRQRDLLQVQGRELTDSSAQLQSCVDNIRTKQESLDQSERRLEEMRKRKRRMERMVLRATEQLITVRKTLGECRRENH
eukprot:CAMPEP_0181126322 /NCGR_PEP_ID=MMETSP1071-20121207/27558_1 /TAXON_ID=35127 /ORGANISM="Thalassiosira sp., Strain NH16" /LENGTH=931 /DNA_ID=CAMNT_0023211897 /DNA_START=210 /DNA_END=3005 /DNA_ORIENTATION=-